MKSRIARIVLVIALATTAQAFGAHRPTGGKSGSPWQAPWRTPPAVLASMGLALLALGSATRRSVVSRA